MKHALRMLVVLMIVAGFSSGAQAQPEDPCQAEAVIAAFAEAVAHGEVDPWLASVVAGACPPGVIAGAVGLADAYQAMRQADSPSGASSGAAAQDVVYTGDDPVVSYANALGIDTQITVDGLELWDPDRCIYVAYNQTTLGVAPGVYLAAGLPAVRKFLREGDQVVASYADGRAIEGSAEFVIKDASGNAYNAADATAIRVISLPESSANRELTGLDPEQPVWELAIPSAGLTFQGNEPRFQYRYVSCGTVVVGISGPFRTSSGFTFALDDSQRLDVNLSDLAALQIDGAAATLTVPGGQATSGTFALEEADDRWYLYLNLGYGRQVWVSSGTPFTLRQITG